MAIIEREPTRAPIGEPTTMKAAVVESFTAPLELKEVPKPVAGPGEIVVKVETSGLCHTDIHAAHGDWPVKPTPPFVPGHEGIGIVESIGEGVTEVAVGDRVAMPWLGYACGTCELLRVRLGDALPRAEEHRLRDRRRLRRVREGVRPLRREGARRRRPGRRGAAHLRRRDDLQGRQGRGHAAVGHRRDLRHRRTRPHGAAVRADRGRAHRGRRRGRREARARAGTRRDLDGERRDATIRSRRSRRSAAPTRRSSSPPRRSCASRPSRRSSAAARSSSSDCRRRTSCGCRSSRRC